MKAEKGITLISLTIYVIVMAIVVGIVAAISSYFYTNIDSSTTQIDPLAEYTKFNSFFTDEANHENIKILEYNNSYIAFDNGVQYTFIEDNKGIYRNRVKICGAIEKCSFKHTIQNGKDVITVTIKPVDGSERTTNYTLKN